MSEVSRSDSEWLNRNGARAFPLVDDYPGTSWTHAGRTVPDWLLRDARFTVVTGFLGVPDPLCARLHGYSFSVDRGTGVHVSATIGVQYGPGRPLYGVEGSAPRAVFRLSASVPFGGTSRAFGSFSAEDGSGAEVSASVVFGAPASERDASPAPQGDVLFTDDDGGVPFLPSRSAVVPSGVGVASISAGGGTATGAVHVADGVNTSLRVEGGRLRLSVGRGLGIRQDCWDPDLGDSCAFIRYINGQRPATDGSFQIVGGEGVTVVNGLTWRGNPAVAVVAGYEADTASHMVNAATAKGEV